MKSEKLSLKHRAGIGNVQWKIPKERHFLKNAICFSIKQVVQGVLFEYS